MQIEYQTQRLSMRFFMLMLVLFIIQVVYGMILAAQHVDPTLLAGVLNFNVARAEHLNLGIMWIVCGFIGSILFVGPLLSKREMVAPWLIKLLFYAVIVIVVWNFFTQFLAERGIAGWWLGQPWLQQGLEYLEAGRIAGLLILVGFAIVCYVVLRTFPPVSEWNEVHWGLGLGVTALMAVWVFGLFYVERLDLQEYFRWFVVHYWVEGVWEVIHISLIGMFLVLMFKADIKSVGFAVFWGITLVWLSGLIGNAHHYFWIGTPEYWQWWGSVFSALEPIPFFAMTVFAFNMVNRRRREHPNRAATLWALGTGVMAFLGAGVWGFLHTLAPVNYYTHGTQVTAAHGHMAFYGAYVMVVITMISYAMPLMRGRAANSNKAQVVEMWGFWLMTISMVFITLFLTAAGILQVWLQRVSETPMPFMAAQDQISLFYWLREGAGLVFLIGLVVYIWSFFTKGEDVAKA